MDDIIDDLAKSPESLRFVTLAGPLVRAGEQAWPMWILRAQSPSFGRGNAWDANRKPTGTAADNAHPLRMLSADAAPGGKGQWMQPRLMDLHLLVGARDNFRYEELSPGKELPLRDGVTFRWTPGQKREEKSDGGARLRTRTEVQPDPSGGRAPFVRVTAEVLAQGLTPSSSKLDPNWMAGRKERASIPLPPLRLKGGRIGLHAKILAKYHLAWLRKLAIVEGNQTGDAMTWPTIWLVPDGIEFVAALPFPGQDKALEARVLLHPDPDTPGSFRLTMVAPVDRDAWLAAWASIIPASATQARLLAGLRFGARNSGVLPVFYWKLEHDDTGPTGRRGEAARQVWVRADVCDITLSSPASREIVDGSAELRLPELSIEEKNLKDPQGKTRRIVEFAASVAPAARDTAATCTCTCSEEELRVTVEGVADGKPAPAVAFDIDTARLASELREAYGLPTPPPVPARREAGLAYGEAFSRPLLPAFVPLEDGWLELPVPNLGPLDTRSDAVLAAGTQLAAPNVLDGFLRIRHGGLDDKLQSGHRPAENALGSLSSPWTLTLEQASGVDMRIQLLPAAGGARLLGASIALRSAVLSASGLVWVSRDRPDAQEALPRLGAGPGAWATLQMQTAPPGDNWPSPLLARFDKLAARVGVVEGKPTRSLDWNTLDLQFRADAPRWVDEVLKPAEAREALQAAADCIETGFKPVYQSTEPYEHLRAANAHLHALGAELRAASAHEQQLSVPLDALAAIKPIAPPIAAVANSVKGATVRAGQAYSSAVDARQYLDKAQSGLPKAQPLAQRPRSAVAWLRHARAPLVANMPMTRAAGGGARPLESRDLFPYALLSLANANSTLVTLASLERVVKTPFVALRQVDGKAFDLAPVAAWPASAIAPDVPERGIAMAMVGVPGAEVQPRFDGKGSGSKLRFTGALRYDLPLLDEAFATAALPPPEGKSSDEPPEPASVPTALDWPLLAAWWRAQERKHQNARVVDSYVFPFGEVDPASATAIPVTTLVRGLTWSPKVALALRARGELPYGHIEIDGHQYQGNRALLGFSGRLQLPAQATPVEVLGYSPATFKVNGVELDNRMAGAQAAFARAGLLERPVTIGADGAGRLLSLQEAAPVVIGGETFHFWFKDVLFLDGKDEATLPQADAAFDVFDDALQMAAGGCEFRFAAAHPTVLKATLQAGRSEIPFFGMRLEPLRLTSLTLAGGRPQAATIECRLSLKPRADGANLVELTLTAAAGAWTASLSVRDAKPLAFNLLVDGGLGGGAAAAGPRRAWVLANASIAAGSLVLEGVALNLEVAGVTVALGQPAILLPPSSHGSALVRIKQSILSKPANQVNRLRITGLVITDGYVLAEGGRLAEQATMIGWKPSLEFFAPGAPPNLPASIAVELGGAGLVRTLGLEIPVPLGGMTVDEANGALSITVSRVRVGTLGTLDGGILVRLAPAAAGDGTAVLLAGHCELVLAQAPGGSPLPGLVDERIKVTQGRLELFMTSGEKGGWDGWAALSARVQAISDIRWPALAFPPAALEVPVPTTATAANSGRVRILPDTAGEATHTVDWLLSGHQVDLAMLSELCAPGSTRLWVTPVTAQHTLSGRGKSLGWSSVEPLVIGRVGAVVPPVPATLDDDGTTFASRYRNGGVGAEGTPDAGMRSAGLGAAAVALRGARGESFRALFHKHEQGRHDRIVFAGGFLGQLDLGADTAPLLRLPVLAGTGITFHQQLDSAGAELAWADGPAARQMALMRPTAPTPPNASFDALAGALLAGSLEGGAAAAQRFSLAGAMLVEQSYGDDPAVPTPALEKAPFFLAAAVSVERVLRSVSGDVAVEALSLVSGQYRDATTTRSVAAAVRMPVSAPEVVVEQAAATLWVVGDVLRSRPWNRAGALDEATHLRALAPTVDADPRGALLVRRGPAPRFVGVTLESLALDDVLARPAVSLSASGRRGLPVAPSPANLGWLAPVVEGATRPIRDTQDANGTISGFGVAGLARRLSLPAHAVASWPIQSGDYAEAVPIVWVSSTQFPAWLPLQVQGLRGMPIHWLQPAPPLVRLPGGEEIRSTLRAASTTPPSASYGMQGVLPARIAHATAGERAGVMTVRRTRLLTLAAGAHAAGVTAFDAAHPTFGAPGEAGSSWARHLRTPRPGPLPANTGNRAADRRVQASLVCPLSPGSALLGAADIVEGKGGKLSGMAVGGWSIQVVASPESASVLSENWDGVLRVVCCVKVKVAPLTTPVAPGQFLACALFGDAAGMVAALQVGEQRLPFRWMKVSRDSGWAIMLDAGGPDARSVWTAEVELLLEPRATPLTVPDRSPYLPFVQALDGAGAHAPAVELQWTVTPVSNRDAADPGAAYLQLSTAPAAGLIQGSKERPSLTLRLPLYPVRQAHGGLPLTPASLVFGDPAYDRDLAGMPASDRRVLTSSTSSSSKLDGRGEVRMTLYADRGRVNRRGVVTLMADIAYERRMDELAQAAAESHAGHGVAPGGDLCGTHFPTAGLTLQLIAADGSVRPLTVSGRADPKTGLQVKIGIVYELPLSMLAGADGKPASLAAGDMLKVEAMLDSAGAGAWQPVDLWHTGEMKPTRVELSTGNTSPCTLNLTLTDEPVIEPPPALYMALQRSMNRSGEPRLAVPLHAQSPLPRRTDMLDAARGFRDGLVRRHACFVWYLSSDPAALGKHSLLPLKSDRTGQAYFPASPEEFQTPEQLGNRLA